MLYKWVDGTRDSAGQNDPIGWDLDQMDMPLRLRNQNGNVVKLLRVSGTKLIMEKDVRSILVLKEPCLANAKISMSGLP